MTCTLEYVDLALFRQRAFAAGLAISAAFMAAFISCVFTASLLLQDGLGLPALRAGLSFGPMTPAGIAAPLIGRRLIPRYGPFRLIQAGALIDVASLLTLALALHALGGAVTPPWIIATLAVAGLGNVSPRTFQDAPSPTSVGCWSRSRSASASQPLRATSRNSSSPWSCVVTKPPMLGLEMFQSENGTGMLPCTSIVVAVRSAFSVNVTERV
jgi:hypothetical protein